MSGEAIADINITRETDAEREQRQKRDAEEKAKLAEEQKQAKIKQDAEDENKLIVQSTLSKLDALEHATEAEVKTAAKGIIQNLRDHKTLANEIAQGICNNTHFSGQFFLTLRAAAQNDATFESILPQLTVAAFANTLSTAFHPAPIPIITVSASASASSSASSSTSVASDTKETKAESAPVPQEHTSLYEFIAAIGPDNLLRTITAAPPRVLSELTKSNKAFLQLLATAPDAATFRFLLSLVPPKNRPGVLSYCLWYQASTYQSVTFGYNFQSYREPQLIALLQYVAQFEQPVSSASSSASASSVSVSLAPSLLEQVFADYPPSIPTAQQQLADIIYKQTDAQNINIFLRAIPKEYRGHVICRVIKLCSSDANQSQGAAKYNLLKQAYVPKTLPITSPDTESFDQVMTLNTRGLLSQDSKTDRDSEFDKLCQRILTRYNSGQAIYLLREYSTASGNQQTLLGQELLRLIVPSTVSESSSTSVSSSASSSTQTAAISSITTGADQTARNGLLKLIKETNNQKTFNAIFALIPDNEKLAVAQAYIATYPENLSVFLGYLSTFDASKRIVPQLNLLGTTPRETKEFDNKAYTDAATSIYSKSTKEEMDLLLSSIADQWRRGIVIYHILTKCTPVAADHSQLVISLLASRNETPDKFAIQLLYYFPYDDEHIRALATLIFEQEAYTAPLLAQVPSDQYARVMAELIKKCFPDKFEKYKKLLQIIEKKGIKYFPVEILKQSDECRTFLQAMRKHDAEAESKLSASSASVVASVSASASSTTLSSSASAVSSARPVNPFAVFEQAILDEPARREREAKGREEEEKKAAEERAKKERIEAAKIELGNFTPEYLHNFLAGSRNATNGLTRDEPELKRYVLSILPAKYSALDAKEAKTLRTYQQNATQEEGPIIAKVLKTLEPRETEAIVAPLRQNSTKEQIIKFAGEVVAMRLIGVNGRIEYSAHLEETLTALAKEIQSDEKAMAGWKIGYLREQIADPSKRDKWYMDALLKTLEAKYHDEKDAKTLRKWKKEAEAKAVTATEMDWIRVPLQALEVSETKALREKFVGASPQELEAEIKKAAAKDTLDYPDGAIQLFTLSKAAKEKWEKDVRAHTQQVLHQDFDAKLEWEGQVIAGYLRRRYDEETKPQALRDIRKAGHLIKIRRFDEASIIEARLAEALEPAEVKDILESMKDKSPDELQAKLADIQTNPDNYPNAKYHLRENLETQLKAAQGIAEEYKAFDIFRLLTAYADANTKAWIKALCKETLATKLGEHNNAHELRVWLSKAAGREELNTEIQLATTRLKKLDGDKSKEYEEWCSHYTETDLKSFFEEVKRDANEEKYSQGAADIVKSKIEARKKELAAIRAPEEKDDIQDPRLLRQAYREDAPPWETEYIEHLLQIAYPAFFRKYNKLSYRELKKLEADIMRKRIHANNQNEFYEEKSESDFVDEQLASAARRETEAWEAKHINDSPEQLEAWAKDNEEKMPLIIGTFDIFPMRLQNAYIAYLSEATKKKKKIQDAIETEYKGEGVMPLRTRYNSSLPNWQKELIVQYLSSLYQELASDQTKLRTLRSHRQSAANKEITGFRIANIPATEIEFIDSCLKEPEKKEIQTYFETHHCNDLTSKQLQELLDRVNRSLNPPSSSSASASSSISASSSAPSAIEPPSTYPRGLPRALEVALHTRQLLELSQTEEQKRQEEEKIAKRRQEEAEANRKIAEAKAKEDEDFKKFSSDHENDDIDKLVAADKKLDQESASVSVSSSAPSSSSAPTNEPYNRRKRQLQRFADSRLDTELKDYEAKQSKNDLKTLKESFAISNNSLGNNPHPFATPLLRGRITILNRLMPQRETFEREEAEKVERERAERLRKEEEDLARHLEEEKQREAAEAKEKEMRARCESYVDQPLSVLQLLLQQKGEQMLSFEKNILTDIIRVKKEKKEAQKRARGSTTGTNSIPSVIPEANSNPTPNTSSIASRLGDRKT